MSSIVPQSTLPIEQRTADNVALIAGPLAGCVYIGNALGAQHALAWQWHQDVSGTVVNLSTQPMTSPTAAGRVVNISPPPLQGVQETLIAAIEAAQAIPAGSWVLFCSDDGGHLACGALLGLIFHHSEYRFFRGRHDGFRQEASSYARLKHQLSRCMREATTLQALPDATWAIFNTANLLDDWLMKYEQHVEGLRNMQQGLGFRVEECTLQRSNEDIALHRCLVTHRPLPGVLGVLFNGDYAGARYAEQAWPGRVAILCVDDGGSQRWNRCDRARWRGDVAGWLQTASTHIGSLACDYDAVVVCCRTGSCSSYYALFAYMRWISAGAVPPQVLKNVFDQVRQETATRLNLNGGVWPALPDAPCERALGLYAPPLLGMAAGCDVNDGVPGEKRKRSACDTGEEENLGA